MTRETFLRHMRDLSKFDIALTDAVQVDVTLKFAKDSERKQVTFVFYDSGDDACQQ